MTDFDFTDYDFTTTFEQLYEYLDGMIDIAEDMFIQINDREQIEFGRSRLNTIDELKKLKEVAGKLQERMEEIRDEDLCISGGSSQRATVSEGLRKIELEVTEGMLRQSLLSMTRAKKANLVKVGEQFTITVPSGEQFTTDLIDPGNKLRERGRIRAFYEAHQIKAGDHVVLKETEKNRWTMEVVQRHKVLDELLGEVEAPTTPEANK